MATQQNNNTLSLNKSTSVAASGATTVANEAAAQAAAAQDPKTAVSPVEAPKTLRRALISVAQGTMTHLFTSQVVTTVPALMEIDQFAEAQIEAGKWIETEL